MVVGWASVFTAYDLNDRLPVLCNSLPTSNFHMSAWTIRSHQLTTRGQLTIRLHQHFVHTGHRRHDREASDTSHSLKLTFFGVSAVVSPRTPTGATGTVAESLSFSCFCMHARSLPLAQVLPSILMVTTFQNSVLGPKEPSTTYLNPDHGLQHNFRRCSCSCYRCRMWNIEV